LLKLRDSKDLRPKFVVIDQPQPRFSIKMGSIERKIFTYFGAASDGSIAFHTYVDKAYSSRASGTLSSSTKEDTFELAIDMDNAVRKDEFITHKINIHQSGIIQVKDKQQSRMPDEEFDKTLSLANFNDDYGDLGVFQPGIWEAYHIADKDKIYIDLIQGNLNVIPPVISFHVGRDELRLLEVYKNHKRTVLFFVDNLILSKFNLKLFMTVVAHHENKYPPDGQLIWIMSHP
jgi:hypothetical protein